MATRKTKSLPRVSSGVKDKDDDSEVIQRLTTVWTALLTAAKAYKEPYKADLESIYGFYNGPHDVVFKSSASVDAPTFEITINKAWEFVQVMGPHLYFQNPARKIHARGEETPHLEVLQAYLDYTPDEFGLRAHSKRVIDKALLEGRGVFVTGVDPETKLVRTVSDNFDNYFLDPMAESWYDSQYIFRVRRNVPLWKIQERYGKKVAHKLRSKNASAVETNRFLGLSSFGDMGSKEAKESSPNGYDV